MRMGLQFYSAIKQQQGIGLIEVLVALLLFSGAALGYTALQTYALGGVNDSTMRLKAVMILNETLERMRANSQIKDFGFYHQLFNVKAIPKVIDCLHSTGCDTQQVAKNDLAILRTQAERQGLRLGMIDCPKANDGTKSKCLIAAWHHTTPTYNSSNDSKTHNESTGCLEADGRYIKGADCVFIESY